MEGQLRPGLRADSEEEEEEEEVMVVVVVLALTVVLEEDVEGDEVVVVAVATGADWACTSLADESTRRCIFSTLTAGVRLEEEKVTEMKSAASRKPRVRNAEPERNAWRGTDVYAWRGLGGQNTNLHDPSVIKHSGKT